MRKKLIPALLLIVGVFLYAATVGVAQQPEATKAAASDSLKAPDTASPKDQLIVYYFHGNVRCPTCLKLEEYSSEALHENFKPALDDSSLVWQVVNFEAEGNEHYVEDYKLFTQSLIISRVVDGKEVEWKNLDQIWQLVGEKEDYLAYVADETRKFLTAAPE